MSFATPNTDGSPFSNCGTLGSVGYGRSRKALSSESATSSVRWRGTVRGSTCGNGCAYPAGANGVTTPKADFNSRNNYHRYFGILSAWLTNALFSCYSDKGSTYNGLYGNLSVGGR